MKNILITGGAGFIGSNLTQKLVKKGFKVTILDNLSKQIHGKNQNSTLYSSIKDIATFIKGDVCNKSDWQKALRNQDAVIHLAAETGTGQSMYEIDRYNEVNLGGTSKLLDCLINEKHSVKKLIVASSRSIYGEGKYSCKSHGEQSDRHRGKVPKVHPSRQNACCVIETNDDRPGVFACGVIISYLKYAIYKC